MEIRVVKPYDWGGDRLEPGALENVEGVPFTLFFGHQVGTVVGLATSQSVPGTQELIIEVDEEHFAAGFEVVPGFTLDAFGRPGKLVEVSIIPRHQSPFPPHRQTEE